MNENEEKEYNDIESLAAYLHSDKMQALKAAEERAEKGLPPLDEATGSSNSTNDVLFTSERRGRSSGSAPKRRKPVRRPPAPAAVKEPEEDTVVYGEEDDTVKTAPERPAEEHIEKPAEKPKKKKHTAPAAPEKAKEQKADAQDIPALSDSLSESLGMKAAEIVDQNKDALPPEDTPEVFDITEGSEQDKQFNNAATRLMNAVNDPLIRNDAMREDMEAEEEERRAEKMEVAILRRRYERQKQSTRTLAYILIALVLCTAIVGAAAFASSHIVKWALDFTGIAAQDFKIDVEIPQDATVETVAAILAENNIISDARFFKVYADFADKLKAKDKDTDTDFIAGKYTVSSTMSYSTLLSLFRTAKTKKETVSVRIIEGMTATEIGKLLEENNVCYAEDFEKCYKDVLNIYDFERRVKQSSTKMYQLEGYLFPDTYEFYVVNGMANGGSPEKGETEQEAKERIKKDSEENALVAAKKMYSNFNDKMTMKMYKKMGEMNMTLDEVVTLASIVQKEAGYAEDMDMVASVFLNRIRHSAEFPYLQSDVTILYVEDVIKPNFKGSETAKTRLCNAYNTYVCTGIPAGPVCNPGLDAINAVLYSEESPYFYFCANPETGEIFYAETEEQHNENKILAGLTGTDAEQAPGEYGEGENG